MKNTKIIAGMVAVVIIGGILFIVAAFLGNPISASEADRVIKQYVKTTYPLLDLKAERAHYNFKLGEYMAIAQSEKSIDTKFAIYSSGSKIIRDNYNDYVLSMFNTRQRLSAEYSAVVKTLIAKELGFDDNTTMVHCFGTPATILQLDMQFDRLLLIDAEVTIRVKLTDYSTEGIAKVISDAYKVFVNNDCTFKKYALFSEYCGGYVSVHGVTTADIEGGELTNLLVKAKNSDTGSGISFVSKGYN